MDENKVAVVPQEEEVIVVNDGRRRVRIQNQLGEDIGVFMFNPTDLNIINRYNEVADQFKDVVAPLKGASITAEGDAADEESIEILNAAENKMIELLDYVIGGDSRAAFFGKVQIFSPSDGSFYCENVLNALGQYISMKFDKEIHAINSRVEKHTHGYRTGKHRKGDR